MPKVKGQCKFNDAWLGMSPYKEWIAKDPRGDLQIARCKICAKNIKIGSGGRYNLESHKNGEIHKQKMDDRKKSPFFKMTSADTGSSSSASKTTTHTSLGTFVTKDDTLRAEILWTLRVIASHYSYKSCEQTGILFRTMFPDSQIASKFACGERKTNYMTCYGLAPHFKDVLMQRAKSQDALVLLFDESYNSVTKSKQMDVLVRLWAADYRISSRYLGSVFMGHGTANDILEHFQSCTEDLKFDKILQVSMDGPNVNWSFYDKLQERVKEEYDCQLLNIGSCGLHIVHGAFKHGCKASTWDVASVLRSMYILFHQTPARREDYTKEMEVTNLQEETFMAQRMVHDHIGSVGGIFGVEMSKDLLKSCAASRSRYQAYLDDMATTREIETKKRKRQPVVDEIDGLKEKRRHLEEDMKELNKSADDFLLKAESQRDFSLVSKSVALRKSAQTKDKEIQDIQCQLDDKLKSLKPM